VKQTRTRATRSELLGALGAGGLVVFFCLALLRHDPLLFWNDDYELSILPVFADVARSWSEGHLPLLSPYSWVCGNLAGEFQYGTFSVFINAAVVLIWKFPLTFPQQAAALSITHLFVLAMGGYLLARGRNLAPALATMVAFVVALNGWIICWGATDWFGALGAFAWLPWAWWAMERALDPAFGRWRFVWPAPFVYLLVTGGFPYTVVMLAVLIVWRAICVMATARRVAAVSPLAIGTLLGLGMSAPAWLALLAYVHGSAREAQDAAAHLQWRVPIAALPAFILPNWTVPWADFSTRLMPHTAAEMACGLVPPVAVIAAFVTSPGSLVRRIKWELALLVALLVLAMVPSAGVFRWSFRWLPFVHLVLALCAGEALQLLPVKSSWFTRPPIVALAFIVATAVMMLVFNSGGDFAWPLVELLFALALCWAALDRAVAVELRGWLPPLMTFFALFATYLCIPPNCGIPKYNLDQALTRAAPLDARRLYLSVYPQPEHTYRVEKQPAPFGTVVRPGSTSMWGGVRFINGYSPIRPAGVARAYNFGIHGQIDFEVAERLLRTEAGPAGELARLGVDGVVIAREFTFRPQPTDEWQIAYESTEGVVYHRGQSFGPIQSITTADDPPNEQLAPASVQLIEDSRDRVVAHVSVANGGPAVLTFSRPYFPGYQARLGTIPLAVNSYRGLVPSVRLPIGASGELQLVYRPMWLGAGGAIALLCTAIFGFGVLAASLASRTTGVRRQLQDAPAADQ
jgi:hypothetical protein